jgi:hypothetical protein
MALSRTHALSKYGSRIFTKHTILNSRWHRSRVAFSPNRLNFQKSDCVNLVLPEAKIPQKKHLWIGNVPRLQNALGASRIYRELNSEKKLNFSIFQILQSQFFTPIPFIVGAPRSGTTLLRLMLDSHRELVMPPETQFIHDLPLSSEPGHNSMNTFLQILLTGDRWSHFQLDAEQFRTEIMTLKSFTFSKGLRCFYEHYAKKFQKKRWGDKTPSYLLEMIRIQQLIPEAHFIHIIRDGRDVALSLRDLWWGPGNNLEAQAAFWQSRIRDGRQQAQFCRYYIEIRYEDLLLHTQRELKKICHFLRLDYDAQMENYYERASERLQELQDQTDEKGQKITSYQKIHRLTQKPPDPSRIGQWKKVMSSEEQQRYYSVAGALLNDLYPS